MFGCRRVDLVEEGELGLIQGFGGTGVGGQDLAEVFVDGLIVVDNEDPVVSWYAEFAQDQSLSGFRAGSSTVNVAPWPGPLLAA